MKTAVFLTPATLKSAGRTAAFYDALGKSDNENLLCYFGSEDKALDKLGSVFKKCFGLHFVMPEANPLPEVFLAAMVWAFETYRPEVVIFGEGDAILAARFSIRIGAGCLTGCECVRFEGGGLSISRSVYNAHLHGKYHRKALPLVIAVSKAGPTVDPVPGKISFEQVVLPAPLVDTVYCLERQIYPSPQGNALEAADFVLVGGRGIGSKENYARLKKLAKAWGAVCGCSRAAAINGWAEVSDIVGQSGHVLRAKTCIALGVSGAAPFLAGISGVKTLAAINTDPNAPIFAASDYGIVGDAEKILDAWEKITFEGADDEN